MACVERVEEMDVKGLFGGEKGERRRVERGVVEGTKKLR